MKFFTMKSVFGASLAALAISATSCSQDEVAPQGDTRATAVKTVSGLISANTTWDASQTIEIDGKVYVTNGATLTIKEGTTIIGKFYPNPGDASALIVTRNGKIDAKGTVSNPIVMTSAEGHKTPGGWGGFVVLGNAPINQSEPQNIEGIEPGSVPAGVDVTYGGSVTNDNSGTIQYVRVEYAGANIAENNELNSFTFGGVGSGTTLNHCQAYYGEDDGFEFFGGTVNAKYLVSTSTHDDAFDFDFGFSGTLQFLVATVDKNSTFYTKDPNGIECDNDGDGSAATPYTHPKISNLTIIGTETGKVAESAMGDKVSMKSCANFRRNCQFTLVNSILFGYPTGILCETSNSNVFKNNIVKGVGTTFSGIAATGNTDPASVAAIGLGSPWGDYKSTDLMPGDGSIAASGASFEGLSGFEVVSYKGAIDPESGRSTWLSEDWVK